MPPRGAGASRPSGPRGRRGGGAPPRRPRTPLRRRDPIKRLNAGLLLVAFVLSLFAGRLVQLQTIDASTYSQAALQQRVRTIDLPAVRGNITDADGNLLAMTLEARAIFADPAVIEPQDRPRILESLPRMLDLPVERVRQAISERGTRFVYLARGVEPDRARMVTALGIRGIGTMPEYRRVYPNDELAAHVVGFVNSEGQGGAGLEAGLNRKLAGRDGWQRVEIGADGQHIPMGEDQRRQPVAGQGVQLTLHRDIQYKAQRAIEKQVAATDSDSGSVIVMDPRNGQILAMAAAPGFDPNDYTESPPHTWHNPVVEEAFEPGSTNKVITAAAAMQEAGVRPGTSFRVPDRIRRYDRVFSDSHPHPTRRMTFAGVLATSSNVGTILASEKLSPQVLYRYLRAFGFGDKTDIGLAGETAGLLKPPDQWSATDRYPIAFGQTVSVNALQMATVYAAIANGGVRVAPQLIAGTLDGDDEMVRAAAPERERVISARTAEELTRMLESATSEEGTAPKARIPGYRVAGKTGTAEIVNPECGCYRGGGHTASFAGFGPADAPQLVVQVVLQDPKRGSHYGGDVAAPVFKEVMSFALQTRKIPPTGGKPPKLRLYADR